MNDKLEDLLGAFKEECEHDLEFLVAEHGASHQKGYSTFDGRPPILKESPFPQSGLFWFIERYVWPDLVLDVGYGDRELIIESMAYYLAIDKCFAPWELVTAAAIPHAKGIGGASWVGNVDFLRRSVEAFARSVRAHWSVIERPTPGVIDRALQQRGQRMLFAQEEQRGRDRNRAVIQASRAFHDGDLAKAADLLEPFSGDSELPASARKILKRATTG